MDIQQAAIDAYVDRDDSVSERFRAYGAALSFAGGADNAGLVGAIENCLASGCVSDLEAGVAAYQLLGLEPVAALVKRAHAEYVRMRPDGPSQELAEADERFWDELDAHWFAFDVTEQLDLLSSHVQDASEVDE
ncbi:hypothetical protein [Sanguibacter sp. HDW7]|uniref:DMP19 family protein n=1 Tax=Sanguibacter sp. HDW7 TaxID=2714931 RepID=UPI00140B9D07|nr:hypothetical protein [Sanguibacter sp. HDW7]QIK84075.1 hypothetical protein G7063_10920 [Sanguibacter sp. HDW7]